MSESDPLMNRCDREARGTKRGNPCTNALYQASVVSKILAEITSVEWERKRRNTKEEKISQQGEKSYSHKGDFGIRIKRNKILAFAGDRSLCAGDCRFYFICI